MFVYSVGQKIDKFIGHEEGVHFDLDDSGATMLIFFNQPTESETSQFKSASRFEMRFNLMYDVIMITVRIGTLNWMDAPYTPHLSQDLSRFIFPQEGQGLSLTLILIDASNGEILTIRLIGLEERFSQKLIGVIMEEKMNSFDKDKYRNNINRIFSIYTTNKIVQLSRDYCVINK